MMRYIASPADTHARRTLSKGEAFERIKHL